MIPQLCTPEVVPDATIIVKASTRGLRLKTRLVSWSSRAELAKCRSDSCALIMTGLHDIGPRVVNRMTVGIGLSAQNLRRM